MAEELTTSSLSEELGYSKGHFCRRFRECFGVTFTEYLQNQRMTYAMSLYIEPDETLSDIAAKCGYADSQYFSRVFTKFAGMSPTKYFNMRRK